MTAAGPQFKTRRAYRYTANTAGQGIDFTDATGLGPADAVIISVDGADRTVTITASGEGGSNAFTVLDGRDLVFDFRIMGVEFASGSSATLEVIALYVDRWGT